MNDTATARRTRTLKHKTLVQSALVHAELIRTFIQGRWELSHERSSLLLLFAHWAINFKPRQLHESLFECWFLLIDSETFMLWSSDVKNSQGKTLYGDHIYFQRISSSTGSSEQYSCTAMIYSHLITHKFVTRPWMFQIRPRPKRNKTLRLKDFNWPTREKIGSLQWDTYTHSNTHGCWQGKGSY